MNLYKIYENYEKVTLSFYKKFKSSKGAHQIIQEQLCLKDMMVSVLTSS